MIQIEALVGLAFEIRDMHAGDRNRVISDWQRTCERQAPFSRMRKHDFMVAMAGRVDRLCARGEALVACNSERPDQIYGWAVSEPGDPPVVHMAYVKETFRGVGVARVLLERLLPGAERFEFSHWPLEPRVLTHFEGARFNPFRAD